MRQSASVKSAPSLRQVLVIAFGDGGDFPLMLGAVQAVRQAHAGAKLTLLTRPEFEAFARLCPFVDEVVSLSADEATKARKATIDTLRPVGIERVYDFDCTAQTADIFRLINRHRRSLQWSGTAKGCNLPDMQDARDELPMLERLVEQLASAGLDAASGQRPGTHLPSLRWVRALLDDPPRLQPTYFGISGPFALLLCAGLPDKDPCTWPAQAWSEIARRCIAQGVCPVLLGSLQAGAVAQAVQKAVPGARTLPGRTDLFQLITLAQRATLFIGNDRLAMNFAAIEGTPGVAMLSSRRHDPVRDRPRGSTVIVIHGEDCEAIGVDDVWRAVAALGVLPATRTS